MVLQTPQQKELYASTLPPIGMLSVASFLESRGIPTDVIDCHVQRLDDVDISRYSAVLFTVSVVNIEKSIAAIRCVKKENPNVKILVGGHLTLGMAEHLLQFKDVDAAALGEGELTAYEYLTTRDPSRVKGLVLKTVNGRIMHTGERRLLFNLDALPFPALDKVPLHKYQTPIKRASPFSSIITSKGCPHDCIFCLHSRVWRRRSPQHVVSEIEWHVNELGVKEVMVNDDHFTLDRQRVLDICQEMKERGIEVKWQLKNAVRADSVDPKLLAKMQDTGLWLACFAPETGSPDTLKRIKKGFTLEQVKQAARWCKDLGLSTYAFYTVGYPWETEEHLNDTCEFIRELDTDFIHISRILPIEGTPLYDEMGIRPKEEFKERGFQDLVFKHDTLSVPDERINAYVRKAYHIQYRNPRRIMRILRLVSPSDFYYMHRYSKQTHTM